ncbi:hypothetical protein ACE38V_08505 [Cytobacillus sp. Hz8]|uniref:hypothetical protein n=1 Tax=Cytobacillus sp. Hz8 TaxID=3347168 RepID=UPI0035DBF44A
MEKEETDFTYRDKKIGHQRNMYDYYQFKAFIIRKMKNEHIDKVLVFSLQLGFFLQSFLLKNFKENYVLDVRDHNKIITYFHMKKLIKHSAFTVLSSPRFKDFLPNEKKYILNHNINLDSFPSFKERKVTFKNKLRISYIGALRDLNSSILFIETLRDHPKYELAFHGEGAINQDLKAFFEKEQINNVLLTGRFTKNEEKSLYVNSHFINLIQTSVAINEQLLLPNRLYLAALYKKPVISLDGSYLSEIVQEFHLGLVVHSLEELEEKLETYIVHFNEEEYERGLNAFFEKVQEDNKVFMNQVLDFCKKDLRMTRFS